MLIRFTPVLEQVDNELFIQVPGIVDAFQQFLPVINDITVLFGDPIFNALDSAVPSLRFIAAKVGTLSEIIGMIPAIGRAFTQAVDPSSGMTAVSYAPPRVAIPQVDSDQVCAALNAVSPGRCTDSSNGMVRVPLTQLVFAMGGAR